MAQGMKTLLKMNGITLFALLLGLTGCASKQPYVPTATDGAPKHVVKAHKIPNAVPKAEPKSRYGNPESYVVRGKRYYVLPHANNYSKEGVASWYGTKFHGKLTSSREVFSMYGMTAASTDLPLPTYAEVTNLDNGRKIIVKVNDRGPFVSDRILDLSYAAAKKLGYADKGVANVRVTTITYKNAPSTKPIANSIYVQVAAFTNKQNALNLSKRLNILLSHPVKIKEEKRKRESIYRVHVGPVLSQDEGDLISILEQNGFSNTISRIS